MAVIAAGTADLLSKFKSIARNILLSSVLSVDTFTIAHRLTNAGGKGISFYSFAPVIRSASITIPTAVQVTDFNGSLVTLRLAGVLISQPVFATVDVICEDPHSITW
jgi:hypothetical protein